MKQSLQFFFFFFTKLQSVILTVNTPAPPTKMTVQTDTVAQKSLDGKEAPCGLGPAVEVKHLSGSQTHQAASYLEKHPSHCQSHNSSEQHGISVHLKCNVANPQIKNKHNKG